MIEISISMRRAQTVNVTFTLLQDIRNTVGNIPMEWYKELAHIGYDLDGKPIGKPKLGDELDEFLNKMDNPDYWLVQHHRFVN